jgi:glycosyltransferase involved in cell wall biosynthesis
MKVIRIIARLNVGGPARHVVWLVTGLSRLGFETVLVAGTVPEGEQDMSYFADEHGVTPVYLREMSRELTWRDGIVCLRLFWLLLREGPAVVHTHTAKAGAAGRAAAVLYNLVSAITPGRSRTAVVHTYHGHVFHSYYGRWKTRLFLAAERMLAQFTDRILVLSEQQRTEISEHFRIGSPAQYQIVPLGMDAEGLRKSMVAADGARGLLAAPAHSRIVGLVGRITAVKNHDLFLEAMAVLASRHVDVGGLIVGDGDLRAGAEQRARALALDDRVRFTGAQRAMGVVYSAVDVLVLTSRNEGTPLSLIEAMICGRPIVATAVGGVVDLLGPSLATASAVPDDVSLRERGVLVLRADATAVADAIQLVLDSPELAERMTASARQFAEATFSVERLVRDVAQIYRDVTVSPRTAR